ncbi:SCO3374 family protein [Streptomyces sp. AC550_RSS872]|uniref:SCO3374 family protein n=1 Tax=Streptomyces sp. AC550_RSS872 TaxID=2823689 RepID=UPI001C263B42|nr:SCO3374 family protein [Streptomyces sp. AC550_RSS872]
MAGMRPATLTDSATIPLPRRPLDPSAQVRRWYENELGWPVVPGAPGTPGSPPLLRVGPCFDVLDVPAEAGRAALRHLTAQSPVAVQGDRMRLLLAAGSAQEVPGVLDWLEWGALPLDLTALGEGGLMEAPLPPGQRPLSAVVRPVDPAPRGAEPQWRAGLPGPRGVRSLPQDRSASVQGAAMWLRPPEPGGEVEASLPTLSALGGGGGGGGAPDLVRVLDTVATRCHRMWLRRACAQSSACP